jgi:hypothetical protein
MASEPNHERAEPTAIQSQPCCRRQARLAVAIFSSWRPRGRLGRCPHVLCTEQTDVFRRATPSRRRKAQRCAGGLTGPTPSFCVCLLFPGALRKQRGPAIRRETSGERHAVADLDRLAGLRACRTGKRQSRSPERWRPPKRERSDKRNGSCFLDLRTASAKFSKI